MQNNISFFLFLFFFFLFLLLVLLLVSYHPSEFSEMHALGNERRGRLSLLGRKVQGREAPQKQSKGWPSIFFFSTSFSFFTSSIPLSFEPRVRLRFENRVLTPFFESATGFR
jgi:hypothetical protein